MSKNSIFWANNPDFYEKFWVFWIWTWAHKNMYFLAGDQKSARNFCFRPNFSRLKKFSKCNFWAFFETFWLWTWPDGRNSRRFGKTFFDDTKNRPESSVSGRILVAWKNFQNAIFGQFWAFFENFWLWTWLEGRNFVRFGKKFSADKNMYFLAGEQKLVRNFFPRLLKNFKKLI